MIYDAVMFNNGRLLGRCGSAWELVQPTPVDPIVGNPIEFEPCQPTEAVAALGRSVLAFGQRGMHSKNDTKVLIRLLSKAFKRLEAGRTAEAVAFLHTFNAEVYAPISYSPVAGSLILRSEQRRSAHHQPLRLSRASAWDAVHRGFYWPWSRHHAGSYRAARSSERTRLAGEIDHLVKSVAKGCPPRPSRRSCGSTSRRFRAARRAAADAPHGTPGHRPAPRCPAAARRAMEGGPSGRAEGGAIPAPASGRAVDALDPAEHSPEWIEPEASVTADLLDGLVQHVASPPGFEPGF